MSVYVGDLLPQPTTSWAVELHEGAGDNERVQPLGRCSSPEAAEQWRKAQAAAHGLPLDHIHIHPVEVPARHQTPALGGTA
jgi:hypothetical protein